MAAARKPGTSKPTERRGHRLPSFVVGLGGSAGGLEAFEQFFASTAASTGVAFVIVSHLDPDHKALLAELVQKTTAMSVREISDRMRLAPDSIYVIPPNRVLSLEQDVLRLGPAAPRGPRTPIDTFFRSLAHERGPTAIGVVLSGMGSDGAAGLRAIKEAGGATLVQDPSSAAFDAMPRAALDAVEPDHIAAPDVLPACIAALIAGARAPVTATTAAGEPDAALARILGILRRRTGHDLSQYKPSTIERRVDRRLTVHRLTSLAAYADYLADNPDEVELLFRELLIGVTHFFRDEELFRVLRDLALPALLTAPRGDRPLRAWVAGCSSGEEAYSLAIILHELKHGRRDDLAVQIYATDLDKNAIAHARAGRYAEDIAANVSPERLARFFTHEDHAYRIRKEIRDTVVFAQHDLISDPPFTRLDLLCCRNVLIYMQPALQQKLLTRFHYALEDGGLLVLGASETTSSAAELFAPLDAQAKVFRSLGGARRPRSPIELPLTARDLPPAGAARGVAELTMVDAARRTIVEQVAPATVVVNERGDILYSSRRTGRYLEPAVGKSNINIFAMAREGLGPHLGLAVRQAIARRRRVKRNGLVVHGDRGRHLVDVTVLPVDEPVALRGLLLVVFEDVPAAAKAPRGRATTGGRKGPAAVERELARTKEHLQAVIREMEAAQNQVETINEELQSTNEELQSTNEEITTSKEELQSLNEELLTLNAELQAKNEELSTANDDLRNLLNSTKIPTLFLDSQLRVKRFTSEATRVAHLISSDVGRAITDITLAVDYHALARDVAEVLDTLVFKEVQVSGHDGASYTMRIHPYRTMDNVIDGVVVTFSDVTALRRAEEALAARLHDGVVARLLDRWPGLAWVRDLDQARDAYLNERARDWLHAAGGADFASLLHPDDLADAARSTDRLRALRDGEVITRVIRIRTTEDTYRRFRDRESVLARSSTGAPSRLLAIMDDAESDRD